MASHRSERGLDVPRALAARGLDVRGGATAEEIAAILAVLSRRREPDPSGYALWRATRMAAITKHPY